MQRWTARAALVVSGCWLALTSGRARATALGGRMRTQGLLRLCLSGLLLGAALRAFSVGNIARTLAGVLLVGVRCGPVFPTSIALVTSRAHSGAATSRVGVRQRFVILPAR